MIENKPISELIQIAPIAVPSEAEQSKERLQSSAKILADALDKFDPTAVYGGDSLKATEYVGASLMAQLARALVSIEGELRHQRKLSPTEENTAKIIAPLPPLP